MKRTKEVSEIIIGASVENGSKVNDLKEFKQTLWKLLLKCLICSLSYLASLRDLIALILGKSSRQISFQTLPTYGQRFTCTYELLKPILWNNRQCVTTARKLLFNGKLNCKSNRFYRC